MPVDQLAKFRACFGEFGQRVSTRGSSGRCGRQARSTRRPGTCRISGPAVRCELWTLRQPVRRGNRHPLGGCDPGDAATAIVHSERRKICRPMCPFSRECIAYWRPPMWSLRGTIVICKALNRKSGIPAIGGYRRPAEKTASNPDVVLRCREGQGQPPVSRKSEAIPMKTLAESPRHPGGRRRRTTSFGKP